MALTERADRPPVPVRTILAAIGLVLATLIAIRMVQLLTNVISLLVVAGFFAIVLTPSVDFLERKGMRRSMATIIVFLAGLGVLGGMLTLFIQPIVREVNDFVDDFPQFVENARQGRGPIGRLVQRFDIDTYIEENQAQWQDNFQNAGAPALGVVRRVAGGLFAFLTVLVLTFLMVLEGPKLTASSLKAIGTRHRERVRRVAADCAKAVTGYMAGNLLISVVAGVTTFVFLTVAGVPFAGVLGLWVAFADLIPLVGATLGAIPTIGVAFLASPGKGIAALIFYVIYQQLENHILQPTIMSRTVAINPLAVLVSVLVGVQLFGLVGALLAIPVAGVLQVIVRNVYDEREGELKLEPTIGTDEVPMSEVIEDEQEPRGDVA
ncbi:MAG TPA: AI-2E family transporter [Acidimicrobiales bacterium]|nr:AI-2E family transporter [Acidimicrobiales bacterium]